MYPPGVFVSPMSNDIDSNETIGPALGVHLASACIGQYVIRMTLYNANNVNDSASVLLNFNIAAQAKSFQLLEHGTTIPTQASYNFNIKAHDYFTFRLDCKNTSSLTKSTKVKMMILTSPSPLDSCSQNMSFSDEAACWAPGIFLSIDATPFLSNTSYSEAIYVHGDLLCIGQHAIRMTLFDVADPNDSASVLLNIDCTTGIEENTKSSYTLGDAIPNPTSNYLNISYSFGSLPQIAKLELYNAIGIKVGSYNIEGNEDRIKINVSELPDGIYFYSLFVNDEKIATKKVVVTN
jgi:hypothetical protein